ncbi:hypothetical protein RN001_010891 [Aquatica leii]|uniref:GH18 domain-containing protein n=1 Tax=Aquatica leii TaxID=1421715 RepID=A0AAN7SQJ5_9COLE|nr:hypothetical protein RN001_010891 [Aquatica leii]
MDKKIVAYYGSWKVYSTCKIEEIDPFVADILIYAFAGLNADGTLKVLDDWGDIQLQGYAKFNRLKEKNSRLKTLLSVGGWNEGSANFSSMASGESTRSIFTRSCLSFVQKYGFDGIDLNWEYPCQRGGNFKDKDNLSQLLKEMRQEFNKHGYLLTMAVGAGESIADVSYDIPRLSQYLNYIFLMTYDFYTYVNGHTGANAPLRSRDQYNVEYCVNYWIRQGAVPSKLLLGIGGYGHSFTLANASNHGIGAASVGPGSPGPDSKTPGILQYCEILDLEKRGWRKEWSEEQQVPYCYQGNQWVGYDDLKSIRKKVDFAKKTRLSGIMLWSVDMDDPRAQHGVKFPLLNTVKEEIAL